jgi:5-methylcytosine-specific restriction endonuclease McrBC regulatory subunit McrC
LVEAARRAGLPAFEVRGRNLFARGVVGVVDIGEVIVELLPKTHDYATADDGRAFLTSLLRFTSAERGLAVAAGSVGIGEQPILEVVLAWAARSAASNMRGGLPRRYVPRQEVSPTIRGRVDLRSVARAKPGDAFKLVIRHAPISEDNAITRILRWLLQQISKLTLNASTRSNCLGLLNDLGAVPSISSPLVEFDRILLHPLEYHWEPLLRFARSLAQQEIPDPTRAGRTPSVAVLFTLHDLFEAALRRVFREKLIRHGLLLRSPSGHLLHPDPENGRKPILRLRPDFVFVSSDNAVTGVGDAKWKRILNASGEVRISEDDAYQLTAYITALKGRTGFLFCPLMGKSGEAPIRTFRWRLRGGGQPIQLIAVHVPTLISSSADGVKLRSSISQIITDAIIPVAGAA